MFIHLASFITSVKSDVASCFSKTTKLKRLYNFKEHYPNVPEPIHSSFVWINSSGLIWLTLDTDSATVLVHFSFTFLSTTCKRLCDSISVYRPSPLPRDLPTCHLMLKSDQSSQSVAFPTISTVPLCFSSRVKPWFRSQPISCNTADGGNRRWGNLSHVFSPYQTASLRRLGQRYATVHVHVWSDRHRHLSW